MTVAELIADLTSTYDNPSGSATVFVQDDQGSKPLQVVTTNYDASTDNALRTPTFTIITEHP